VLANVLRRDEIDSGREHAPLRMAQDAVVIDSTDLTIEEVFARIRSLIEGRDGSGPTGRRT
jgi:cytidylate kinase